MDQETYKTTNGVPPFSEKQIYSLLDRLGHTYKNEKTNIQVKMCPFCHPDTSNPTNQWKLGISREFGAFNCFRCGIRGSWQMLEEKLLLPPSNGSYRQTSSQEPFDKIWAESIYISQDDAEPLRKYLKRRGLSGTVPESIRFHRALAYYDSSQAKHIGNFPALIGEIVGLDGIRIGIQRIYLTDEGTKAPVAESKKILGHAAGGAIRLAPFKDVVGIAEGIETALAVQESTKMPMLAAVSAPGLVRVQIPPEVEIVNIWGDQDRSGAGQKAAEELAHRLYNEGKKVYVHIPPKELLDPGAKSKDWLDIRNFSPGSELILEYLEKATLWSPSPLALPRKDISWPEPLSEAAFHGIVGKIVRLIEPHTEADPSALLFQLLTVIGNIIGRDSFYQIGSTRHYLNLFVVLVGKTSLGRKGTSLDAILELIKDIFPEWYQHCRNWGLSSGEGLIHHVRDRVEIEKEVKDKVSGGTTTQFVVEDEGVLDKRLQVTENEFASVLKQCMRDSNILSSIIRLAWDTGDLSTLSKNSPEKATGAHISVVGHITLPELRRYLSETDILNGFGNRFLWVCVQRSKMLPFGGEIESVDFSKIKMQLQHVVHHAGRVGRIFLEEDAREIWREIYPVLSQERPGMFGAMIGRAPPYVFRIASLYALLDERLTIGREHLQAALAVWEYCEKSCEFIFGDYLGDTVADRILQALRESKDGLTRTEIRDLFQGHVKSERTEAALDFLREYGLATLEKLQTGGRPTEKWRVATRYGRAESANSSKTNEGKNK